MGSQTAQPQSKAKSWAILAPWRQKLKTDFHQFHLTGLLEEQPMCKILAFILLLPLP